MTASVNQRPAAIRVVIPFVFRHWLNQPLGAAIVTGGLLGATAADLFMPVFSGRLVDALTVGASDPAARRAAFTAFGVIVALGLLSLILRQVGLHAIVPFSLRIMSDVSPSCGCSASRPTGTPTVSPARPCARSPAACGRSICSTIPS
jgi:ATP-binding cassette subfamily B protein